MQAEHQTKLCQPRQAGDGGEGLRAFSNNYWPSQGGTLVAILFYFINIMRQP